MTGSQSRRQFLKEVEECVCRDRQNSYSDAEDNFSVIAELWTTWARTRGILGLNESFDRRDVAMMSALIKVARAAHNLSIRDNWIDLAGYAACGGGITIKENQADGPANSGSQSLALKALSVNGSAIGLDNAWDEPVGTGTNGANGARQDHFGHAPT